MGPKPRSTTLTEAEEAIIVEFRRDTLLPVDDVLGCLKDQIPRLNGQAERMNRTVKDGTTKVSHYSSTQALCAHVLAFVSAHNFAKHLKALRWRTPFQTIRDAWKANPNPFQVSPHHLILGPNT